MEDFLNSIIFRFLIFPIGSAVLGVGLKYTSRNDQYTPFRKEDLAVGLELVLTACLTYVVVTSDRAIALHKVNKELQQVLQKPPIDAAVASKLQSQITTLSQQVGMAGWTIAFMFLGLWGLSTVVRKWGWKSETEMTTGCGITLPLVFGVIALILVMAGAR